MDMTAYWLNFKKKRAGDGKYYYFYPYTRCEIGDTPTFFIDGKQYVRIEVSKTEYMALREMDDEEYNDERSVHNKRWTADIPRLENEDGDAVDFWADRAEDKRTHDVEGDICEEMDRKAAVRSLSPIERRIYHADRAGFTQCEIAKMVGVDQATVSRKLDRLYDHMNAVRLHDGERTRKELAFEIGWESFLRNGNMKNDADIKAFAFFLRASGDFLALLYKWFFTPGELLRYTVRYLMIGGSETKEELLAQLSGYGQAIFAQQEFADEIEQILCLRLLREVERRAVTIHEPSGNAFYRYEEEIKELAHRRRLSYSFYFEELLTRKYKLRRIGKILSYAKRIAARTRNAAQKAALREEIIALEREYLGLKQILARVVERCVVRYERMDDRK